MGDRSFNSYKSWQLEEGKYTGAHSLFPWWSVDGRQEQEEEEGSKGNWLHWRGLQRQLTGHGKKQDVEPLAWFARAFLMILGDFISSSKPKYSEFYSKES